jgi:hypothetical protein
LTVTNRSQDGHASPRRAAATDQPGSPDAQDGISYTVTVTPNITKLTEAEGLSEVVRPQGERGLRDQADPRFRAEITAAPMQVAGTKASPWFVISMQVGGKNSSAEPRAPERRG